MRNAAGGQRKFAEAWRTEADRTGQHDRAKRKDDDQRKPVARRRIDRQPPQAVAVGQVLQDRRRLKHDGARQRAGRQDRNELDADDKAGADHRGDDLRDEPRALGANRAKQRDRQQYRDRDRARGQRDDDAISGEPTRAAEPGEDIDRRRRQNQRHRRDAQRHRADAHREKALGGSR